MLVVILYRRHWQPLFGVLPLHVNGVEIDRSHPAVVPASKQVIASALWCLYPRQIIKRVPRAITRHCTRTAYGGRAFGACGFFGLLILARLYISFTGGR